MIEYRGKEYYNIMKMSSSTLTLFLKKSPRKVAAGLSVLVVCTNVNLNPKPNSQKKYFERTV